MKSNHKNQNTFIKIENEVNSLIIENDSVYNLIQDSIKSWKRDSLKCTSSIFYSDNWMLDKLLLYNNDSNIVYGYILEINSEMKDSKSDALNAVGGVKINDNWYFFFMNVYTVIDRNSFQDSIYAPLSLDELSYLAHENLFSIIKKDVKNIFYVDENFFQQNFYNLVTECPKDKWQKLCVDNLIIKMTSDKYRYKLKPEEIEEMKKQMAKSVRPPEPKQDISLWQRLFGKEEKLFESKEWKEYLRNKYGKDVN